MTEEYTIEKLEKTFKKHAEKYELDWNQISSEKLDFNMSEALHVICREINQLKRCLNILLEDDQGISDEQLEDCMRRLLPITQSLKSERLSNLPID